MDGMLDCEFQCGRPRMGLFCKELLPPPASAQLPVLGKRLWLLQSQGGHVVTGRQTAPFPGGWLVQDIDPSMWGSSPVTPTLLGQTSAVVLSLSPAVGRVLVPEHSPHSLPRQYETKILVSLLCSRQCDGPALSLCFPRNKYLPVLAPLGAW